MNLTKIDLIIINVKNNLSLFHKILEAVHITKLMISNVIYRP